MVDTSSKDSTERVAVVSGKIIMKKVYMADCGLEAFTSALQKEMKA